MEKDMTEAAGKASELNHQESARFIVEMFQRTILHHGLWFAEVKHQMGMEQALPLLTAAASKSLAIQMRHMADLFGFTMVDGVPSFLLEMEPEKLQKLKDRMAKNWLANDGVWFQTVEKACGMNDAKRCNDSCWGHFSPVEAHMIREYLGLSASPGLEGLKKALGYRMYESINVQSIVEETDTSFVFQMNHCRVQEARNRKGMEDYPCKSGGLVEYAYFAKAIDKRIKTECLGCPPDKHPKTWYCAWKFSLVDSEEK